LSLDRPAAATVYYADEDADLARFILRKSAGADEENVPGASSAVSAEAAKAKRKQQEAALERRLGAMDVVVRYCTAGSGCRRQVLLSHFDEVLGIPAGGKQRCCDLCREPAKAAAAVTALGRLCASSGLAGLRNKYRGGGGYVEEDTAGGGVRARSKNDPHGTGLVDGDASDEDTGGVQG